MLYGIFTVFKFFFGLGALAGLIGIGLVLVWFALHLIVRLVTSGKPVASDSTLHKLFLDSSS